MLYILVYWCYLLFVTSAIGVALKHLLRIKNVHPAITPIMGLFVITIFASFFAIFEGLSIKFEIVILILSVVFVGSFYRSFSQYLRSIYFGFNQWALYVKVIFIVVLILALIQCSTAPYLVDNESYYIQTIKWLDTYGFVPGLANLHIFLAQFSGWHICQSALNLDYIYSEFNDLNGFFLVLGTFYSLDRLNEYFIKKELHLLFVGLFPLFYLFLFQFLSAPSPDLPVYMLTMIIFSEYIGLRLNNSDTKYMVLLILVLFTIYIKVIAFLLLIFPIVMIRMLSKKEKFVSIILSLLVGGVFIIKNVIISGYPLYPLPWFEIQFVDWQLPKEIMDYVSVSAKYDIFQVTQEEYLSLSFFSLFIRWLSLPGLYGFFNILMLIILLVFPFTFIHSKHKKNFMLIFAVSLAQMILLSLLSLQYRFYIGYLMVLISVVMALIFYNKINLIKIFIGLSIFLILLPLFFNLTISTLTRNDLHQNLSRFKMEYLMEPHVKSRYIDAVYETFEENNTIIYTPVNIDFFWGVGDGPLPSLQKVQYNYFKVYYHIVPVQRTVNLKDGFYSKILPK